MQAEKKVKEVALLPGRPASFPCNIWRYEAHQNQNSMPAKDFHHDTVLTALVKDGWTITAGPLTLFHGIFMEEAGQLLLEEPGFRIIVFDPKTEEIVKWIPPQ